MWILTRSINEYDQDGEYFESAWIDKPKKEDLFKIFGGDESLITHLLNGGGRRDLENTWYYLTEFTEGTEFEPRV